MVRYTIEGKIVVLQVVRSGESLGENTIISNAYSCTAIAFLCTDEASFINGAVIPIDGGFHL